MAGLMISRIHGGANSEVNSAAVTAIGMATTSAIRVTLSVPTNSGISENSGGSDVGFHVYSDPPPLRVCGRNILPTLASFRTSLEVKMGSAFLPIKIKISTSETIATHAQVLIRPAAMRSIVRFQPAAESGMN